MKITLYWRDREYDLTDKFDIFSYNFEDSIDGTISTGFISTKWLRGKVDKLDLERGLPRYSILKIGEKLWYIGEYVVKEKSDRYKHDIPLVSLEKALQRKLLPAMTLRQPVGVGSIEDIKVVNSITDTDKLATNDNLYGVKFQGKKKFMFDNSYTTEDNNDLDKLYLKAGVEYNISFETMLACDIMYATKIDDIIPTITLTYNGDVLREDKVELDLAKYTGFIKRKYETTQAPLIYNLTFTPEEDGVLELFGEIGGQYFSEISKFPANLYAYIRETKLTIKVEGQRKITAYTLDYWVERLLKEAGGEYYLSDKAKARLGNIVSNEQTLPAGFDLYTALSDVAETIGATFVVDFENKGVYHSATKEDYINAKVKDTIDVDKRALLEYSNTMELDRVIGSVLRSKEPDIPTIDDYYFVEVPTADYDYEFQVDGDVIIDINQNNIFDIILDNKPKLLDNLDYIYENNQVLKIESVPYGNQYWRVDKHEYSYVKLDDKRLVPVIDFIFYEDLEKQGTHEVNYYERSMTYDFDNYVNELEINASNIVDNATKYYPYKNGKVGLRALERNTRMTDTNIGVDVGNGIYKIEKFIVSGLDIETTNGDVYSTHDITRRVLDKRIYDTLPKNAPTYNKVTRLFSNATQNSTIYYVDGDSRIYGMGNIGSLKPEFIGTNRANRSLFEACAAEISEKYDVDIKNYDKGQVIDKDIRVYIEYKAYNTTRASVLKEDQSGFNIKTAKNFNDLAKLNDANTLGSLAERTINRLGNNIISVNGYVEDLKQLPELGSLTDGDYKLVSRNISTSNRRFYYRLDYVKDFSVINRNKGVDSPIKLYDVPMENIVVKRDKVNNVISFDLDTNTSYLTDLKRHMMVGKPITSTFAEIDFDGKKIGASVNEIRFNNTITWNIEMEDNYSAGMKQVTKNIAGEETTWSEEVRYTDRFGNVDLVDIKFYEEPTFISGREEDYPEIAAAHGEVYSQITYLPLKDAGEVFAHTHQITYLGNDRVNVYNTATTSNNVGMADFDYIPSKQATKIDLTRVRLLDNTMSVSDNYISPDANIKGVGWGLYDKDTLDLVLFVKGQSGTTYGAYNYNEVEFWELLPEVDDNIQDGIININYAVLDMFSEKRSNVDVLDGSVNLRTRLEMYVTKENEYQSHFDLVGKFNDNSVTKDTFDSKLTISSSFEYDMYANDDFGVTHYIRTNISDNTASKQSINGLVNIKTDYEAYMKFDYEVGTSYNLSGGIIHNLATRQSLSGAMIYDSDASYQELMDLNIYNAYYINDGIKAYTTYNDSLSGKLELATYQENQQGHFTESPTLMAYWCSNIGGRKYVTLVLMNMEDDYVDAYVNGTSVILSPREEAEIGFRIDSNEDYVEAVYYAQAEGKLPSPKQSVIVDVSNC